MMDKEYKKHELWLDRGQKEPVRIYLMGKHVTVEVKKKKNHYSAWLDWEQVDLLIEKLQKVKEVKKKQDEIWRKL